jgi:hypothetical protein
MDADVLNSILDRSDAVMEFAQGVVDTSGDNAILAAPGSGYQYLVCKLQIQSESSDEVLIIVKWGSREVWRLICFTEGAGGVYDFPAPDRMEGRDNQPLILNLNGAYDVGYSVQYYVVGV